MRSPTVMRLEAKRLEKALQVVEAGLGAQDWLLASGFSAVDCAVGYGAMIGRRFVGFEALPRVAGWLHRCEERPAFGRAARAGRRGGDLPAGLLSGAGGVGAGAPPPWPSPVSGGGKRGVRRRSGMAERVEIFEVGPRDGLQNEARMIPAAEKIALVDCLSGAGFAPDRGGELREPEVGAADGRRGGGAGRHPAGGGRVLRGAGAEPDGVRAGDGGGGGRGGGVRARPRRGSAGRTSTARSRRVSSGSARWRRRRRRRDVRDAGVCLLRGGVPLRRAGRAGGGGGRGRRGFSRSGPTRCRSATPSGRVSLRR